MTYRVVYKVSVAKDLRKIPKADSVRILDQIENELAQSPQSHPALKGPYAGLRRFRVGNYRVVYAIQDDEVLVLRIGHREGVYK